MFSAGGDAALAVPWQILAVAGNDGSAVRSASRSMAHVAAMPSSVRASLQCPSGTRSVRRPHGGQRLPRHHAGLRSTCGKPASLQQHVRSAISRLITSSLGPAGLQGSGGAQTGPHWRVSASPASERRRRLSHSCRTSARNQWYRLPRRGFRRPSLRLHQPALMCADREDPDSVPPYLRGDRGIRLLERARRKTTLRRRSAQC